MVEQREGKLIQASFAADLLNVSRQRVDELMKSGQLKRVEVNGHPFVTVGSVEDFCKTERKAGRPRKFKETLGGAVKRQIRLGRELADHVEKM